MDTHPPSPPGTARDAWLVFAAGVCAALHVGKLPPAIAALQAALGMTLVEAGFLLSLVQAAGMVAGIGFGVLADTLGGRRSLLAGLVLLTLAGVAGAGATGVPALLALRAVEGCGFLLVVLPAPGLIRQLVPPARVAVMMGVWGTYMPLGASLALLTGPMAVAAFGWRVWWLALAALTAAMALAVWRGVPAAAGVAAASAVRSAGIAARLRRTLSAGGPWLVALSFAVYSSQWLAVIGFLPVLVAAAGIGAGATGVLAALAAAANIVGNLAGGRLVGRGVAPPRLLAAGFATMGVAAIATFAELGQGPALRYFAVLLFSMVGGMIPATLFALALRLAPGDDTVTTTVGWMQQWSAFGQFAGPPLVAWIAARAGGWQWTWAATGSASLLGLLLAGAVARRLASQEPATT